MRTHRQHPESAVDPIAFKKLYRKTEDYIQAHDLAAHEPLLEPLAKLIDDKSFWDNNDNGLAIFCSPQETKIIKLPEEVEEISCVAQSFCVRPLFSFYNRDQQYYLLTLGLDNVKLYEGTKYHIEEINISETMPTNMNEALGDELTDNHLHASAAEGTGGLHGYMEKSQEEDNDMERFFRKVDQDLREIYPASKDKPLLVAMLPEHQNHFLRISKNQYLKPIPLNSNPHALHKDMLLEKIREILAHDFEEYKETLLERAQLAQQEGVGSSDLGDVVRDALDGKIEVLFIESEKAISGHIDRDNRRVQQGKTLSTDVINELSCLVFDQGGHVIELGNDEMLSETGVFTINRY
jgi:hypothetical protein